MCKARFPYRGVNLLGNRQGRPGLHALAVAIMVVSFSLLARPIVQIIQTSHQTAAARVIPAAAAQTQTAISAAAPAQTPSPSNPPSVVASPSTAELPQGRPAQVSGNRLIIPSITVDMPIVEGQDAKGALRSGAWRLPLPNNPQPGVDGQNVVLAGHRWYRTSGPNTLFRLNAVDVGDIVEVHWEGSAYRYQVATISVVDPKQVDILESRGKTTLTIFTCTPLFSTKQRLVVVATPVP
mgnify:FL=1